MIRVSDHHFIANALYVAAERYREDAECIRKSTMNEHARKSLSEMFDQQADRAVEIANELEE